MSLINDLIYFDNPTLWDDFGGTSGGLAGLTWQMMIWSVIVGLLVFVYVRNYIKNKIDYYLSTKNKKTKED